MQCAPALRGILLVGVALLVGCGTPDRESQTNAAQRDAVRLPISCIAPVQADFDHAVVLLHHMTYAAARAEFRSIAERDPNCAMAQWGIAMTLFQPLWPTRPSAQDLHDGWNAVQKAQSMRPQTPREEALIAAMAAFFRDPDSTDYWQRIENWEAAMASAHAAFPSDHEVTAF